MSNADIVLRVFDAINRRDVEAAVAETTEDVVVDFSRSHSPYRGVYEGQAAVRRFWTGWIETWDCLVWTPEDLSEVPPDRVVLVNHLTGTGRGGIEVDARGGHVWELAGGKVSRMALFQTLEDAHRFAGAATIGGRRRPPAGR
jgi:ketosteroid isomerase-like protein